ncbi:MAG: AAA family ATPase [Chloroflexota bacterium]
MALTTDKAAAQLGVSVDRVRALIHAGRLPAEKHGRDWVIRNDDLALVRTRHPGRPRTATRAEGNGNGRLSALPTSAALETREEREQEMRSTIAVMGKKGGSAKTTTAFNLAGAWAEEGRRCLLVDLDAQASLTLVLLPDLDREAPGIGDRLIDFGRGIIDLIQTVQPGIDLVPGNRSIEASATALAQNPTGPQRLRRLLLPVLERYDRIILDTAPALGFTQTSAMLAADLAVIPTRTGGQQDLDPLPDIFMLRHELADFGYAVADIAAILPSQYHEDATTQRNGLAGLRAAYGPLISTPVPYSRVVERAMNGGVPLTRSFPQSGGAHAFRALARQLDAALAARPVGARP